MRQNKIAGPARPGRWRRLILHVAGNLALTLFAIFALGIAWKKAGWPTCSCQIALHEGLARHAPLLFHLIGYGILLASFFFLVRRTYLAVRNRG